MTDTGAIIKELITAGCDPVVAAQAAMKLFQAGVMSAMSADCRVDKTAEKRRAYDREYRRNQRNVGRQSADSADVGGSHNKEDISNKKDIRRGSRLSADWTLTQDEFDFALNELGTVTAVERERDKFRDYWSGKAGATARKSDWSATWRNWVRNAHKPTGRDAPIVISTARDWDAACKLWKTTGRWPKTGHGNDPDSFSCVCPPEFLIKYGIRRDEPEAHRSLA